jgi:hypothetical protein
MNIIELAEQAGMVVIDDEFSLKPFLDRFAHLVRNEALTEAAEYLESVHRTRLVKFADAIRALKEKT